MIYESPKLVYVGKVIDMQPIENADFIVSATVVCGHGGKWKGIVRKADLKLDDKCIVFLPDSIIPQSPEMQFMEASNWRVKMRKFKGAPSEVLITPYPSLLEDMPVGSEITQQMGVTKYHKPVPAHLQGIALGFFPDFIPKTDELNYQMHGKHVDSLVGEPYYITEKADGSSSTAYRYKGHFGVCSRNLELVRDEKNGYWEVAMHYKLEDHLPEGIAVQWETCGPGVQKNPMGFDKLDGLLFSAYNIEERRYLNLQELIHLSNYLKFPMCTITEVGLSFSKEGIELKGEGIYLNGKQREGVVIRSQRNHGNHPISFKVINLNYET